MSSAAAQRGRHNEQWDSRKTTPAAAHALPPWKLRGAGDGFKDYLGRGGAPPAPETTKSTHRPTARGDFFAFSRRKNIFYSEQTDRQADYREQREQYSSAAPRAPRLWRVA